MGNCICFIKTATSLWNGLRCCLGCRICSRVLVFNSSWLLCHFSLVFFPFQEFSCGKELQLPCLWSFAGVTPWLLLCQRLHISCSAVQVEMSLLKILIMVFQNVMGLQVLSLLRKHEWNTNSWHHTYISCNLLTLLSKQKISTSQEYEAGKCEAWYSHLHISPRMLFRPHFSWVCCFRQNKEKVDVPLCFSSFV